MEFPTDTLISLRLINILTAPAAVLIYGRNNLSTDEQCGIKPIVCEIVRAVKWRVFLLGLLLTTLLKYREMRGYQFMRQKPIGNYIVDFYCSKLKLVIEIDGESHEGRFS